MQVEIRADKKCVANIMQIWRDGEADKLTQLVFCDISTPQAAPSKKAAKALDNPTLHALEQAVPLDEPEPVFTVYEDIRQISAEGKSIFAHDPNGKVAERYKNLTQEVIKLEKQREKSRAGSIR